MIRYWNPAAASLFGLPAETAIDEIPEELRVTEWLARIQIREDQDVWRGRVRRPHASGGEVEVDVRLTVRRDSSGDVSSLVEFATGAAHYLEVQSSRAGFADKCSLDDRFRRLLQNIPIPLLEVDARCAGEAFSRLKEQGITNLSDYLATNPGLIDFTRNEVKVTQVNKAAVALFGAKDENLLLGPVRYLFDGTPGAAKRVMEARFCGMRNHVEELKLKTLDERLLDVLLLVTYPRPPENLDTTFIMLLDISDRIAAEAEIRKLQGDFTHASRIATLGELATSIAHEVKQPLSAIMLNGEASLKWLNREEPNLDRVRLLTERMVQSSEHADRIINRIRSMATKQELEWELVCPNEIVHEAMQFVRHECVEKQVEVHAALDDDLPFIMGDRVQLQQVLVNLLLNAVQAIDLGNSSFNRRIDIITERTRDDQVAISVEDSGPGINPEIIDHLFEGFFSTKPNGMGMGLAICRTIIQAHSGEIVAGRCNLGGALFRCQLPLELQ
ncbi:PAS domain-containing protein [Qipengyuania sp. GH25]|uniref:histidine kinase n=2 Tax=Qipengyuania pacifica TaxID=2860199 RepID=A0ABS7JKB0_9SPHN|nr:PAS domain-containing protein [Qipengyuania aerophila]